MGLTSADPVDLARLQRLLGQPELAWLVARVRQRIERGLLLDGAVSLADATAAQRTAIHRLLGRAPRPGATVQVSLRALDHVLRRSGAATGGLEAAIVALTGPVVVRADAAVATETAWRQAFAPVETAVADWPELTRWYAELHATGVVRRLTGSPDAAVPILARLARILTELPAVGETLGRFAARTTTDAHALDDDRPLSTLALSAARALGGVPPGSGAEWRREVWASVGLLRDELSSTVLVLGLRSDDRTATGRVLGEWAGVGQPAVLTLRQLVRDPPSFDLNGLTVSVCENPVVLAEAAERLGAAAAPVVCTSGQPGSAVMHLLRLLAAGGADLRYHCDFDWGGLRIANVLHGRLPFRPWRFDTATYTAHVSAGLGGELTGTPTDARWDAGLGEAMRRFGVRIEEELVIDDLLGDLAR